MYPIELMQRVADACRAIDVRYCVVGSVASSRYGDPRTTKDVDIVVELPLGRLKQFHAFFPEGEYYFSEEMAIDAIQRSGQFNIIHPSSGMKADIMIPGERPYDELQVDRARLGKLADGSEVYFAAPEDVILHKLLFYREGGSDKHLRDIASMLKISGEIIDRGYIEQWALRLAVAAEWRTVVGRLSRPTM